MSAFVFLFLALSMSARAQECPTLDLAIGETVNAALDAGDCRVREILGTGTNQAYAKRFRLTVTERAVFTITQNSEQFDTFIYVYTQQLRLLGSNNDTPGQGTDSRVVVHLTPGTYFVLAAAALPDLSGAFQIKAVPDAPRPCPTVELAPDTVVEGSFSSSTCRFVDLNPLSSSEAFVAFYRIAMPRTAVLNLQADTSIPRFSTVVSTPDLDLFSGGVRLTVSLLKGTALASFSASAEGSYTLRAAIEDFRSCRATPMEASGEVTGTLESTGCRILDLFPPSSANIAINLHQFRIAANTVLQLDQVSTAFDSTLLLFDEIRVIGSNGNATSQTADSRILIHLPPGSYIAGATASDETQLGVYTLRLSGDPPRACPVPELAPGETLDGTLSASPDCRVLDLLPLSSSVLAATPFKLNAATPSIVSITGRLQPATGTFSMISPDRTEVLRLLPDRDGLLAADIRVQPGDHTLMWYSTAAARPAFTLRAAIQPPPNCPAVEIASTAETSGELAGSDCRALEILPYLLITGRAKVYNMKIASAGLSTVSVESTGFVPFLIVATDDGRPVGVTGRNTPGALSLSGNLRAGDYKVVVGSRSLLVGSFRLQTRLESSSVTTSRPMQKMRLDELPLSQPDLY